MLRSSVLARIDVQGAAPIVAGVVVCAALLLAAAPAQASNGAGGGVTCGSAGQEPDSIYGEVVPHNVTVPPGGDCNLIEYSQRQPTIVDGNVTVGQGGALVVYGSVITGNLYTEGAQWVILIGSVLDGNASIDATRGIEGTFLCPFAMVCLLGNGLGGNVSITNTSPAGVAVIENFIVRNLACTGNVFSGNPSPTEGPTVSNYGFPNTVLGHESGQCVGL